jgi:uncharacterized damage-inducible protein DinB
MASFVERQLSLLGAQPPAEVLRRTPDRLGKAVSRLGDLSRSAGAGKWSGRQILAHLTDMEIVFGYRLRQALSEDDHSFQLVDQDAWARRYESVRVATALEAFRALRLWNLGLLDTLGTEDLSRSYTHPDRGSESLDKLLRIWAGHDLNHLGQLENLVPPVA